ncbi:DUF397 domain-containing protein [Kitasatospora sp. NPDC051984]|uniref:DUF397 domain-containing protein n=1 Tax=Kitasatospora sp. NPDC051984 TaxID=3364059 RepID=UPI0037CB39BB
MRATPNESVSARRWRKSSYSGGNGGTCVEVDDANFGHVRDSKDPEGAMLKFTPKAWATFVSAVADGEFGAA